MNWKKAAALFTALATCSAGMPAVYAENAAQREEAQVSDSGQDQEAAPGRDGGQPGGGPGGQPGGGPGGQPGGGPEGQLGGGDEEQSSSGDVSLNRSGAITVSSGSASLSEEAKAAGALEENLSTEDETVVISDLTLDSEDYGFTGISASDSDLLVKDSSITLGVSSPIGGSETPGTAIYADSGSVEIENSTITVNGAGRYSIAAENTASMTVNDSVIAAGGDNGCGGNTSAVEEPFSNAGLLISGNSRSNFSIGQTHTAYYNSLCLADGWAALSTDSASGSGLEFIAYNTEGIALNGGYGVYADTGCRDYLFGTKLISAEVGAILSNNGELSMQSSDEAKTAETKDGTPVLSGLSGAECESDTRSLVIAGRNDFQLHSPDMMGEGNSDYSAVLNLSHTDLVTDGSINEEGLDCASEVNGETYTVKAETDYGEKYGEAIGAYIDYVSGAAILVKSTSANITLEDVTIDSESGVCLLSALNSDSMSRYLKEDTGNGVYLSVLDSSLTGSFVHDDYQRDLTILADGSSLSGAVSSSDYEAWNAKWENVKDDESCSWYALDPDTYVTDAHDTVLVLTNGSVWNVTGESSLSTLAVCEGCSVEGAIEAETKTLYADGTAVYTNVKASPGEGESVSKEDSAEDAYEIPAMPEETAGDGDRGASSAMNGPAGEGGPQMGEGGPQMGEGGPEGGTPPEKPDGEMGQGAPSGMPGGGPDGNGGPGGSAAEIESLLGSWSSGGTDASSTAGDDYAYDAALMVTAEGIDEENSSTDRISSGSYDAQAADGITINDSESGHNGVIVYNTPYEISHADLSLLTDADGSDTCDFSGKGTAVAAFGKEAVVRVSDSKIHTSGVATMPVFADDGAVLTIENSSLTSDGGTLYKDYMNTPDQALMVAPPWILGIMGNARGSNMMGDDTTTNVIDSEASAGAWAVLSTDAGSDMTLNVYHSTLTLNNADESLHPLQEEGGQISESLDNPYTENYGSGYGTYVIGDAAETFAGSDLRVGTYASILTGGSVLCTDLEAGESYELTNSKGEVTASYTAAEDQVTTIDSDTFGFMAHQGSNQITLQKGTTVRSGYASFLVKTGASNETLTASVDDTVLYNGGVLIQLMDNDDTTNGGMMDADDPENTNGGSQNFKQTHTEEAGFSTEEAQSSDAVQTFTFTNGSYSGNIYNASGSDGLSASALSVTFGPGAVYSGAAAPTSAIHVTYEGSLLLKNERGGLAFDSLEEASAFAEKYQNTSFGIEEYFHMGHVGNLICDNGANRVDVTLTGDACWEVTGTSILSSLSIQDDARVVIPEGVTLTAGGNEYTACTLTAETIGA